MPNITITEKRQLTEIAEREGWAIATGSIVLERCEFTGDELERRGDFMAFISGGVPLLVTRIKHCMLGRAAASRTASTQPDFTATTRTSE